MPIAKMSLKDEKRGTILRDYGFGPKTRGLFLLDVSDPTIEDFLKRAGKSLDLAFISLKDFKEDSYIGFDAYVGDLHAIEGDLPFLMTLSIVPIVIKDQTHNVVNLSEFDPMKFTGNAFLFESLDPFQVLEKIIRYLENIRYSGDRRTLLANVTKSST